MYTKSLLAALLLMSTLTVGANEKEIKSPDGKMTVAINDEGGRPTYTVSLDGQQVLQPSALGVKANFDDLTQGLTLKTVDAKTVNVQYDINTIKQRHAHDPTVYHRFA